MAGKHITQANEATVTALKTLLKLLNINDEDIKIIDGEKRIELFISPQGTCLVDLADQGYTCNIFSDATNNITGLHAHGSYSTEAFLVANDTETFLSLNAPNDEALTTISQNSERLSILTKIGNYFGTGKALLNFPLNTNIVDDEYIYTLPLKSGDIQVKNYKEFRGVLTVANETIIEGPLEIGKKYIIKEHNLTDDFTNVGATDNFVGTIFIATGTTPTIWTNESVLMYDFDPIVNVLESDFPEIIWSVENLERSLGVCVNAFTLNKTFIGSGISGQNGVAITYESDPDKIVLLNPDSVPIYYFPFEIRVYF